MKIRLLVFVFGILGIAHVASAQTSVRNWQAVEEKDIPRYISGVKIRMESAKITCRVPGGTLASQGVYGFDSIVGYSVYLDKTGIQPAMLLVERVPDIRDAHRRVLEITTSADFRKITSYTMYLERNTLVDSGTVLDPQISAAWARVLPIDTYTFICTLQ